MTGRSSVPPRDVVEFRLLAEPHRAVGIGAGGGVDREAGGCDVGRRVGGRQGGFEEIEVIVAEVDGVFVHGWRGAGRREWGEVPRRGTRRATPARPSRAVRRIRKAAYLVLRLIEVGVSH